MNEQGYVPITFIASFKRIRELSENINHIIQAMAHMEQLELNDCMVRK